MNEHLERIIEANSKWMEANAENPEALDKYPVIAASTMQSVMLLAERQKETAGEAAIGSQSFELLKKQIKALEDALSDTSRFDESTMIKLHERLTAAISLYHSFTS